MSIITVIFQAIGQALTFVLPISEGGHSSIFHELSGRYSGACSQLTGLVHLGIALGLVIVFYKLFIGLFVQFFGTWGDLFRKRLDMKKVSPGRHFMFMSILSFVPMLFHLIPAGKYGNVYGFLKYSTYNGTLLDDGIWFAIMAGLLIFAPLRLKKESPNKKINIVFAMILGISAFLAVPVSGLSLIGVVFAVAVLLGISPKAALRYAIVLSVPVLIVMGIIELFVCVTYVSVILGILAVILSAAATYLAAKTLVYLVNNTKLTAFAYYNLGMGLICVLVGFVQIIIK